MEFRFLYLRHLSLEQRTEHFLLVVRKFFALLVFFHNQAVYDVAIHTGEVTLFELLFQHVDHRYVQLAVHEQYVVAFVLGRIDVSVLFVQVVGVEVNQATVLVGLVVLDQCLVFFEGVILVVCILEQSKLGSLFIEIFLSQHTIVDENLQVVPFLFKFLTVVLEDRLQAVGYLLRDVSRNLLHVRIALQVRTRNVQRNVRRIDDTVKQGQEVGHDTFY